jgi:TolB-like protein/DNA-binding winged helix-turn-helix (wHTH) protein
VIYRFDRFWIDDADFRLYMEETPVALEPKALRVLLYLVENRNRLVRKRELLDQIWGDANVAESTLTRSIGLLRKTLEDDSRNPRYIETVPTVGFRFIARVDFDSQPSLTIYPASPADAPDSSVSSTVRSQRRNVLVLVVGCVLLVLSIWLFLRSRHMPEHPIRALAVLPFENLSNDPDQDYFVQGMTDELTTTLARVPNLTVISRNSAAQTNGAHKSVDQLARQLKVDAVIEGSVLRSGRKVRINAQLIDVHNDRTLWAESFEGSEADVLTLQDNVATMVAHAARLAIVPSSSPRQKVDPPAQDAYLRGRYFLNKQDTSHAIDSFDRATALEPDYASAYAGLADALDMRSTFNLGKPEELMPRARAAAQKAIQLDPENGEAYTALGSIQTIWDWNFAEAERNLLRGIALSPAYPLAEVKYAALLDATGRTGEAVTHMQRALELDPVSFFMTRRLAATLYFDRRYDEALASLHAAEEMQGFSESTEYYLAMIYQVQGRRDEAVAHGLLEMHDRWPTTDTARLQSIYQRQGWQPYFQVRRSLLLSHAGEACATYEIAVIDVTLGDLNHALQSMNHAVDQRCYRVVWARADPLLAPLWNDPRSHHLLDRIYMPPR